MAQYCCQINDEDVPYDSFQFGTDSPIFTDGSAVCVGTPSAAAGAAAFQIDRDRNGVVLAKIMRCSIPHGYRISPVGAEHFAMHMSCRKIPQGMKALLVADCAAAANANLSGLQQLRAAYRIHDGFW